MHRKVAAALVAALALGVASCGSSEPQLTRAQLVRKVEVACRQGQQVAARKQRAGGGASFIAAVAAGQQAVLDRIGDLNAPDAARDDFDAFKQGMRDRLDLIHKVAAAGRSGMQRAIRDIQPQAEAATRRISAAARSLGIEGCI